MYWIKFLFGFIFIALDEIIKFSSRRPIISLLFIFGFWITSLPLPEENVVRDNSVTVLGQNQKSHVNTEYQALIESDQDKVILAAFHGKFLVNFRLGVDQKTKLLNANFRVVKRTPEGEMLDLGASIPEDRVLVKLYQVLSFGVKVPPEIDLNRARSMPTRLRLEYLRDCVSVKTVKEAYDRFAEHLDNEKTDVFFGEFGRKYKNNVVYKGFYAYNDGTKNMMFFREDRAAVGGYSLHSYMKLDDPKSKQLKADKSIF